MRKILHFDLDAFYPSVEQLDNPSLAGRAVIVGGLGDRGVVASASYEAREVGVHSAMPMALARRRCKHGVFLRPRFARYRAISRQIFAIYRDWTQLIEPLSIDEAYLDVSARPESGLTIAAAIRQQVREQSGLTVSAGSAHNKFLAKLASDLDKPDGLTHIEPARVAALLQTMPVRKLWGVGPATASRLVAAGLTTVGEVAAFDPERLAHILGSHGHRIAEFARGRDARPVQPRGRPSSISAEVTVEHDLRDWRAAAPHIRRFAQRIEGSLLQHDLWARTLVLKVRFHDFRTLTRSATPGDPLRDRQRILELARQLARRVEWHHPHRVRLVGLGVTNLGSAEEMPAIAGLRTDQLELFGEEDSPCLVD